jgi:hypothetical protein
MRQAACSVTINMDLGVGYESCSQLTFWNFLFTLHIHQAN